MTDPGSPAFPAPNDDDDDDVAWALSTAQVQWKRGSQADAVVWLRRAIDSAVAIGATWRAAELTRQTDQLEAYLMSDVAAAPAALSVPEEVTIDDFESDVIDEEALSLPPDASMSEAPEALSADATDERTEVTPDDEQPHAAVVLDDDDDDVIELDVEDISEDDIIVEDELEGEDAAASSEPEVESPQAAFGEDEQTTYDTGASFEPEASAGVEAMYEAETGYDALPDTLSEPEPLRERAEEDPSPTPVRLSASEPFAAEDLPPHTEPEPVEASGPMTEPEPMVASQPVPEPEPEPEPPVASEPASASAVPAAAAGPAELPLVAGISLEEISGFEDFPPETQLALAHAAWVERLAHEEEVSAFGLALVLRGEVAVMPAIADVACGVAGERELVYGRGTLADGVALRLVARAPDTQVAIWDFDMIDAPLAECPWVLDELQEVADRFQALAGVSMGPMGDRLDDSLRGMVLSRCKLVRLLPGEVLVEKGKPVGGLFIVGAGRIELVDAAGTGSEGELGPGDFLFAPQVLAAGAAPTAARAGAAGALLMAADRHAAHELMVSVPPLLELLAG